MKDPQADEWYHVEDISEIDSPALLLYPDRVKQNIRTLLSMVDDAQRLRPHVKTHKTKEAALLMMDAGIGKFKCATISEAEMLAIAGAPDVLLAYQPVAPKLKRFIALAQRYGDTIFSCLVDNRESAKCIAAAAFDADIIIPVYIDLNVGMNRTGIRPGESAIDLYKTCSTFKNIHPLGLHVYDGHIKASNLYERTVECDKAFTVVEEMRRQLTRHGFKEPVIIAGGSTTFPIHAKRKDVECSPGTFIYWDRGYEISYPEQAFIPAAIVITRVISMPDETTLCLDLGHKSISAENELHNRVHFLNAPGVSFVGHSEEHLVVEVGAGHTYKVGDVFYGLPFHICPTCALYERGLTIENHTVCGEWKMMSRERKINV